MMLTDRTEAPVDASFQHYGIGYYTDSKTERVYFYARYYKYSQLHGSLTKIYRFDVNVIPLTWEYIGEVKYAMDNTCISSCGRYFWSIKIFPYSSEERLQDLYFRRFDFETLNYDNFECSIHNTPLINMRRIYLRYTQQGTFVFVSTSKSAGEHFSHIDEVFRMRLQEDQKLIELERIEFSQIPTLAGYPSNNWVPFFYEKWKTGITEVGNTIYFYRIDYFGDVYVSTDQFNGPCNWTKFTIEGNYRPGSWLQSNNRNFDEHMSESLGLWLKSVNCINRSYRCYLPDDIVYETNDHLKVDVFYRLELLPQTCVCKCTELFRTSYGFSQNVFTFIDTLKSTRIFAFNNGSRKIIELLFFREVPKLKYLAYWCVRRNLRSKKGKKHFLKKLINRLNPFTRPNANRSVKGNSNLAERKTVLNNQYVNPVLRVSRESIIQLLRSFQSNQLALAIG
ncbi:hypothetical protein M3Y95_00783400 [Aphelenchoides besseyi]|nr:hypothetical protein M3Y95_00783400 [Aphelenchoides besseyi]